MLSTAAKNQLLAASPLWASIHSAWPGSGGSNEVAISRVAVSWGTAANAKRQTVAGFGVTIPAGNTAAWLGFWNAQIGGTFQGASPLGGLPYDVASNPATGRIIVPYHPFTDGQTVVFYGGTPPAPLVEGTTYYVRDALSDQFRVTDAPGGSPIQLTAAADFQCLVANVSPITIVGTSTIVNVPRVTMRWTPNYPPVWDQGVTQINLVQGGTFDLRTICADRNNDTLTFTLTAGSEPLPAGVTLNPNGILSAASNATVGQLPWVYFDADDGQ